MTPPRTRRPPSPARLRRRHLSAAASDPLVGEAVERAKLRLGSRREPEPWATLGLLACGRHNEAYERVQQPDDAHAELLAAHYIGWTGDLSAFGPRLDDARERRRDLATIDTLDALTGAGGATEHDGAHASWRAFADERFERGYERWRALAADPDAADGALLAAFVYGLLGAVPDASVGRLTLRPRLPAACDRFTVERLRLGGSDIALEYRRDTGRHTFRLEQRRGAVPVQLVFAPALPTSGLAAARVDGEPAELDFERAGDRTIAPLQLVLDHPRTLEFDAREDDDARPAG